MQCVWHIASFIELWQIEGLNSLKFAVRFMYNLQVKGIPGCSNPELCPYDEFLSLVSKILPSDDLKECQL